MQTHFTTFKAAFKAANYPAYRATITTTLITTFKAAYTTAHRPTIKATLFTSNYHPLITSIDATIITANK